MAKTATWIYAFATNGWADTYCSHCGFAVNDDVHVKINWNFCPNCGRQMVDEVKIEDWSDYHDYANKDKMTGNRDYDLYHKKEEGS